MIGSGGAGGPTSKASQVGPGGPARSAGLGGAGVEVVDLSWRPFGRKQPVLSHLDLTIRPGERVLLAGPSGSGKSTLLRALAGLLLTADAGELSGTVAVDGDDPQHLPGAVGLVLQDPGAGVVASRIGRDVAFGLENVRVPPAAMPPVVSEVLAEVGLVMAQDASPSTLSGGESQRLALAGALALSPQVLLLDEPTAMLDAGTAATVRRVVDTVVARRGLTLVVVEHRLDGWVDLVDRLIVLDASGAVVADGEPSRVLAAEGESLLAQGIWVPGAPAPSPLALEVPTLAAPTAGLVARDAPVVTGKGVTVEHRSRRLGEPSRTTVAVRDTDLSVPAGASVALVGPSGAGKSTLMAALGGLVELASGTVTLAEAISAEGDAPPEDWASVDLARAVAWVPQRAATSIVGRTVREDVLTTPYAVGLDRDLAARRVDALLEALGLAHLAQVDPRNLSGGEQRRLAVAAAVAHGPALVLADEPTVGQDRLTWSAVLGVLDLARREGSGVLVTTHDPGVIDAADQVVHLEHPTEQPSLGQAPTGEPGVEPLLESGPEPGPAPELAPRPGPGTGAAGETVNRPLLARVGPLALLGVGLSVLPLPALLGNWRHGL
ncbi:MAG: ATP-binding cassette domain-containing protein, partial [Dermatophilaceae bacterium]